MSDDHAELYDHAHHLTTNEFDVTEHEFRLTSGEFF